MFLQLGNNQYYVTVAKYVESGSQHIRKAIRSFKF